jgi:hypothetical protein
MGSEYTAIVKSKTLYIVLEPCQNVMPVVPYKKFNVHTCSMLFAQSAAFGYFNIRQCGMECCLLSRLNVCHIIHLSVILITVRVKKAIPVEVPRTPGI